MSIGFLENTRPGIMCFFILKPPLYGKRRMENGKSLRPIMLQSKNVRLVILLERVCLNASIKTRVRLRW